MKQKDNAKTLSVHLSANEQHPKTIQHFNYQLTHTTLKNLVTKTFQNK